MQFKGVGNMGEEVENQSERQIDEGLEDPIGEETEEQTESLVDEEIEEQAESLIEEETEEQEESLIDDEIEEQTESPVEHEVEDIAEKPIDKPIKKYKKFIIGIIIVLCTLLIFYLGITAYFINHFYSGTEINGIDVSGKSVKDVEILLASKLQSYTLNLEERGGKSEQIKAADVGLRYPSDEEFKKLKKSQNPFDWILTCFNTTDFKMTVDVTYDEELLKERIDKLACFDNSNIIEPKNPSFQYVDNGFVIVNEILGNKVDKDILFSYVSDALLKKEAKVNLESMCCYINPQYTSNSQKIIEAKDILNKYSSSKITYTIGINKEVLDGSTIHKWLTVDERFGVEVDKKQAEEYIDRLAKKYDTIGMIRNFTTTSGKGIQVGGGDYGRPIDIAKETQNLVSAIKEGRTIIKEPSYSHSVSYRGNSDIGDTYVEIDLTSQHLWFYKKASLIVEGNVVTGNVRSGLATPRGVYRLKYKAKNAVLRGPGYAAPVNYWMPFNGGIGMHDANWRSAFGGNIYKTDGSHGCINCPNNLAKAIYNGIEPDTPIICY
ncbi:MAG: hypothetical protein K0S71_2975 [Clostridia bacterium]|jgi:lipoprotein-anchoring transpeptidase ErfK/SrfK|nr:hypothetical protein [Clostridia bacterium]